MEILHQLAELFLEALPTVIIVFLFYSNLLMGEFTQSNGQGKSLWLAMADVVTGTNLAIALASALIGYVVFEFLRKKL